MWFPEARVAIGHGQMPPEEMEKVITGFVNFDFDVLVATTIIESGVDIPNANTIIIEGAQNFGLSDLHQMRGRVGRSNKKAYCYLLTPPVSSLPDDARRRLEAIEGFSDLGSGFSIALQDLDIRGAGNLLGAEQSGFIADLGYETYQRVLNEAVNELKTQEFSSLYEDEIKQSTEGEGSFFVEDCNVESDIPMFFPETYVPGVSEKNNAISRTRLHIRRFGIATIQTKTRRPLRHSPASGRSPYANACAAPQSSCPRCGKGFHEKQVNDLVLCIKQRKPVLQEQYIWEHH